MYFNKIVGLLFLVKLIFLVTQVKTEDVFLSFKFKKCIGHSSICDDQFNEKVVIVKKSDGSIVTSLNFNHSHIVDVSSGKIKMKEKSFLSSHLITNNLNNIYKVILKGNPEKLEETRISIWAGNEKLADISLIKFD